MSVQRIRDASTTMRERSVMATPGPWRDSEVDGNRFSALVADQKHPDRMKGGGWEWDNGYGGCLVGESLMAADRRYLAGMNPLVGLALADWLDAAANSIEHAERIEPHYRADDQACQCASHIEIRAIVTVADLILGGGAR